MYFQVEKEFAQLMYFQVQEVVIHHLQKEFTVLTNVLPSRKKSSLFLLMYFQVEKQEVQKQKEFTVLTNVHFQVEKYKKLLLLKTL